MKATIVNILLFGLLFLAGVRLYYARTGSGSCLNWFTTMQSGGVSIATRTRANTSMVPASGYKLAEDEYKLDAIVHERLNGSPDEAIFVGHILREAARQVAQIHGEDDDRGGYSWSGFWRKVKMALISAAEKVKAFFKEVGKHLLQSVKEVATAAAEAALDAAKEKALQIASEIVDRMAERSVAIYSLADYENNVDFVTHFCERMDLIGKRLIEEGEKLRPQ